MGQSERGSQPSDRRSFCGARRKSITCRIRHELVMRRFFYSFNQRVSLHACVLQVSGEGEGTYIFLDHIFWEYYNWWMFASENNLTTEVANVLKCAASCASCDRRNGIFPVSTKCARMCLMCAGTGTAGGKWSDVICIISVGNDVIIDGCLRTIWSLKRPRFWSIQLPWVNHCSAEEIAFFQSQLTNCACMCADTGTAEMTRILSNDIIMI